MLDITDVYPWDKTKYLRCVYLTDRTDHPGGDMVLKADADKTHLLGGTIQVLPQPKDPRFGKYVLTPREVRKLLAEKGWQRVVAFQTRNPLHRAHEYALVYGLETLLRAGHNAGACLNPLIGETKGDDVDADVRMHTYEALIQNRALGDGDSDPALWGPRGESVPDRVILLGLDIKMFYGGPKEAVMHAIYRQNFGFTDIIIGRKHADAPYHDGKPIWGDFDAQEIFDHLAGDLKIQPAAGRLRRLLPVDGPGRSDGQPQGREAGVHLRQGSPQVPAGRPAGRSAGDARRAPPRSWPPRWRGNSLCCERVGWQRARQSGIIVWHAATRIEAKTMSSHAPANDARLNFRLPTELKQTIEEAAARIGQSVSDFAVSTLVRTARDVIEQENFTRLSNCDRDVFTSSLDDKDARPNQSLMAAARKYKNRRG